MKLVVVVVSFSLGSVTVLDAGLSLVLKQIMSLLVSFSLGSVTVLDAGLSLVLKQIVSLNCAYFITDVAIQSHTHAVDDHVFAVQLTLNIVVDIRTLADAGIDR